MTARIMENSKSWWFTEHIRQHYPERELRCPYCHKTIEEIVDEVKR